jgi:hypothetical protein
MGKGTSPRFEKILLDMAKQGLIEPRTENNKYLKLSYKGTDGLVSPKWNIKIYTTNMIVCTDMEVVKAFHEGRLVTPDPSLKLIQIDDAGWGFPLCGILIGVCQGNQVVTGEISVSFFKPGIFERKIYLQEYASKGLEILQGFQATTETHRVEICTGFINSRLRDILRKEGYDVRSVEIKGLLQDSLEGLYKKYIREQLGVDLAYDPKEIGKNKIPFEYHKALKWGRKYAPEQLKSGWKSIQESDHPLQQTELFKYLEERTVD